MSQNECQLSDDNKTIEQLMQEANLIFDEMKKACTNIVKTCKKVIGRIKRRSCIKYEIKTQSTYTPPEYDAEGVRYFRHTNKHKANIQEWRMGISLERWVLSEKLAGRDWKEKIEQAFTAKKEEV